MRMVLDSWDVSFSGQGVAFYSGTDLKVCALPSRGIGLFVLLLDQLIHMEDHVDEMDDLAICQINAVTVMVPISYSITTTTEPPYPSSLALCSKMVTSPISM